MAKSKKSKILASMLAVSTMAVFYVAPVMAAELEVELDGQGIVANEEVGFITEKHEVTGTLTIAGAKIATALTDTDLTLNSVTANTISTTGNNFIVGTDGNVSANSVTTSGDVVTLSGDVLAGTYSLKDIGVRTQNMTATEGNTVFTGNVSATGTMSAVSGDFGGTVINAQGINVGSSKPFKLGQIDVTGRNLSNVGWITASDTINTPKINGVEVSGDGDNGLTISSVELKNGLVDGVDVSELASNFNTTNANVGGITRTEGATDPGTGTTTIEDTLSVSKDSVSANVGNSFFNVEEDGIYMSNNGNGLAVGEDGISAYSGNASFNISNNNYNVTVGNSTMVVNGNGATFTNGEENGSTVINGGVVTSTGDFITLDEDGKQKYTLNTIGADLDTLEGNVGNIGENVGGIDRVDADNDGKKETTIVEDILSVSKDQIGAVIGDSAFVLNDNYAGIYADNKTSITVASDGINLNGTVNFIGHDGNSYTLSNLEGRVSDLEEKTQNIKLPNEPGQGGETGDPNVPATGEGITGVEGDVTVGGDLTVNGGIDAGNSNIGGVGLKDGDVTAVDGNFSGKVTVGGENGTSITGEGITVGDKNGVSIKNDEVRVGGGEDGKGGSYMNDTDVVTGEGNSLNDTANRVGNLEQGVSELNNRVGELEDRIDKVGAMAAAIANLRTMGYDPAAPTEVAVGIGQYRDETGAALGLFHYPNRDFMLSLSVSTSGDEVMGGIGATWKFGRKSPEKVAEIKKAQAEADARRAEEAKLAKAEEMKQAAKEAKIKAQQERHAKLAAERAAQAEAAK